MINVSCNTMNASSINLPRYLSSTQINRVPIKNWNPYYRCYLDMVNGKARVVYKHRLIVEKTLNIKLRPNQIIHHIDRDKLNNSLENLQILDNYTHLMLHKRMKSEKKIIKIGLSVAEQIKGGNMQDKNYHWRHLKVFEMETKLASSPLHRLTEKH